MTASAIPSADLHDAALVIRPWSDPVIEAVGFAPENAYLERCWTPVVGPTTVLLWRRLAIAALEHPGGLALDRTELAGELGVGPAQGLERSLRRLVDFGGARVFGDEYWVRTAIPPLPQRRLARLPASVQAIAAHLADGHGLSRHNPLLEAALDYAGRGWPVLPLVAQGKVPDARLVPHGLTEASTDAGLIESWWAASPLANVAIATGSLNGIDVVDLDPLPDGPGESPDVLGQVRDGLVRPGAVVATGRGWHLYFGGGELPTRTGVLPGIDVRGAGGYVVAPPSVHPSGVSYRFVDAQGEVLARLGPDPMPPAPAWLVELCRPAAAPPRISEPRRLDLPAYARAALDSECAAVAATPEGSRNDRLNRAAFAMGTLAGAGVLEAETAGDALVNAGRAAGLPETEARRTVASGLSAGLNHPRTLQAEDVATGGELVVADQLGPGPARERARPPAGRARGRGR